MDLYGEIYEFAASAGALEGYVFLKEDLGAQSLDNWIRNLVKQYHDLPADVRDSFQDSLDRTIGRAIQSLIPILGKDHPNVQALMSLTKGRLPDSPTDFEREKDEKREKYGN